MKAGLRFFGFGSALLVGVVLAAVLLILVASEFRLRRTYPVKPERLVQPSAAAVADAPRLAKLLGCRACHDDDLGGGSIYELPGGGSFMAPNLTELIRQRTDQQIAAAIRQGVAPDGQPLIVMPSGLFSRLTDEEVSALIAWMRSLPVKPGEKASSALPIAARWMILNGDVPLQPELVPVYRNRMPRDRGPGYAAGRHISATICAECHAPDLTGGERPHADFNTKIGKGSPATPSLDIVGAYDLEQFRKLLRTGVPPSGKDLGMMSEVAKEDFSRFTDEEIKALHEYLVARAQAGQ